MEISTLQQLVKTGYFRKPIMQEAFITQLYGFMKKWAKLSSAIAKGDKENAKRRICGCFNVAANAGQYYGDKHGRCNCRLPERSAEDAFKMIVYCLTMYRLAKPSAGSGAAAPCYKRTSE